MALTAHHTGDGWDFSYIDQFDEYVCLDKFFPSPKNWITDDELEDLGFDVV